MGVSALERSQSTLLTGGSLLARAAALAIVLVPLLGLLAPTDFPQSARSVAAVGWVLSTLPVFFYVLQRPQRRRPIPALATLGLSYGYFFCFQIVVGNRATWPVYFTINAATDFDRPAQYVLVGWVAMLAAYLVSIFLLQGSPTPWKRVPWVLPRLRQASLFMLWSTIPLNLLQGAFGSNVVFSTLVAIGARAELLGMALIVALAVRTKLPTNERWLMVAGIVLQLIVSVGTGAVAGLALRFLVIGVAGWAAGARLTWPRLMVGIAAVGSIVVLRGLVHDYRAEAWFGERQLSLTERIGLWRDVITGNVVSRGATGTLESSWDVVGDRTDHLALLADVSVKTPGSVPYWGGQTYLSLVGSFVPRALWPDKPEKRVGQDFGHRYGYLTRNDLSTSFNLPYPIEFYVNFGEVGIVVGMLIVGVIFGLLDTFFNRPGQPLPQTALGIGLILPVITHLESDFSLTFGGLILNSVAAIAVLMMAERYASARGPAGALLRRGPAGGGGGGPNGANGVNGTSGAPGANGHGAGVVRPARPL